MLVPQHVEQRHLHQRDGANVRTLLRMATINGMHGLQLDALDATFAPGAAPGAPGPASSPVSWA